MQPHFYLDKSRRFAEFSLEFSKNHLAVSVILSVVHLLAFSLISALILYFLFVSLLRVFSLLFLIIQILSPTHKHGPFLLYKFGGFTLFLVLWWTD